MIKKVFSIVFASVLSFYFLVTLGGCESCNNEKNISSYDMTCTLDGDKLTGVERVKFYNSFDNTFNELKFNIFGNAFRKNAVFKPISQQNYSKAYYNGESYGEMLIEKVTSTNKDLSFEICGQDENVLCVNLENELFPNESVTIDIYFTLKLANVNSRTGITKHTINLGNFYPILCGIDENGFYECVYYSNGDPFFSDMANYNVNFTCEKGLVIACSGKKNSEQFVGDKKVVNFSAKNVRSIALVLSEEFFCVTDNLNGIEINYYYYNDSSPEKTLKIAKESLDYFSSAFGLYPYNTYSVVQTDFIEGGMEYPTLVFVSSFLEEGEMGEVTVHETAHQWWQTTVGNNEIEYGFLDEGLAEYSTILFYENHPEYGYLRKKMIENCESTYKVFCSVYDKIFGKVNTVMLRPLGDFNSEYEYVNIAYIKPCIMYDMLRKTIGEDKFFKALNNYFSNYKFKNATPFDLVGQFENTNTQVEGFFDSFFQGKSII